MEQSASPTPYPEVNVVLHELLAGARSALGEGFVGLYLYGSLATGDFEVGRSDIDFLVVTRELLPPDAVASLEVMHRELGDGGSPWAKKLEGVYVPLGELRRVDLDGPRLPAINEGQFYQAALGSDWVIQRSILREHETIVAGPSIRGYIAPVSPAEIREVVRGVLREWWAPMLDDSGWLDGRPEYQVFAVQTMCRALCALRFGTAVTKTAAARWASGDLEPRWAGLIDEAMSWRDGRPFDRLPEVLDFLRFVVQSAL